MDKIPTNLTCTHSYAMFLLAEAAEVIRDEKQVDTWCANMADGLKLGYAPKNSLPGAYHTVTGEYKAYSNILYCAVDVVTRVCNKLNLSFTYKVANMDDTYLLATVGGKSIHPIELKEVKDA